MDKGYGKSDGELLQILLKLQERTSPIRMSIGYISDGNHVLKGIVLHKAAPAVIEELIKQGYTCDLMEQGMLVYKLEFRMPERADMMKE
ncbi:MAG: hypothetical protein HDR11_06895 [Lachnospiraceae bacterium]|nr:hypothetical protein [Lachnospiraceae bacterium]